MDVTTLILGLVLATVHALGAVALSPTGRRGRRYPGLPRSLGTTCDGLEEDSVGGIQQDERRTWGRISRPGTPSGPASKLSPLEPASAGKGTPSTAWRMSRHGAAERGRSGPRGSWPPCRPGLHTRGTCKAGPS